MSAHYKDGGHRETMQPSFEQVFLALTVKQKLLTEDQAKQILGRLQTRTPEEVKKLAIEAGLPAPVVDQISETARKFIDAKAAAPKPAGGGGGEEVAPGYQIASKLGVGGTATVFMATAKKDGRKVALKILHPKKAKDELQRSRFLKEARLLTEFEHPNLVKGYEFGENRGLFYFAMEYVDGVTVQEMIDRGGAIEESKALDILLSVAKSLEYLHSKGYVHKDIKPGNIMVTRDARVKLCDLGFAESLTETASEDSASEEAETTVGTVQFMSPEQAQGKRGLDLRSDIYSLGATLYYMVMGELPFKGESDLEQMAAHVLQELDSAGMKTRKISPHMNYFIERMMSKDRELRFETAQAMVDEITQHVEGYKRVHEATRHRVPPPAPAPAPAKATDPAPRPSAKPDTRTRFSPLGRLQNRFKRPRPKR